MLAPRVQPHVCLSCRLLQYTQGVSLTVPWQPSATTLRPASSLSIPHKRFAPEDGVPTATRRPRLKTPNQNQATPSDRTQACRVSKTRLTRSQNVDALKDRSLIRKTKPGQQPKNTIPLSANQRLEVLSLLSLRDKLKKQFAKSLSHHPASNDQVPIEEVLHGFPFPVNVVRGQLEKQLAAKLEEVYSGRPYKDVVTDLAHVPKLFDGKGVPHAELELVDQEAQRVLKDLDIIPLTENAETSRRVERVQDTALTDATPQFSPFAEVPNEPSSDSDKLAKLDANLTRVASLGDIGLKPLDIERTAVPRLSHDLSRVLFNPGIYHLQDPRSRVWNFDPYLGNIMPVSEFNYSALNKYITSSEDDHLRRVALEHDKRYIGSTSSMSSVLAHFHFLLSGWRELRLDNLSRGFQDDGKHFTRIQRGPSAIFLRYRDGNYAVDADKEFDSANVLMSLGRSMEKLLTLEKNEFEKYRRTHDAAQDAQMQSTEREAYHYSELGQFLIRSQLDAHDPRLPGSGMFDLKTRAVAAVRMMMTKPAEGSGYQIKSRFGTWESFEREYYDMMRSAFLKYSLQVRMGRMDGIFVAYHNIERLFGFQYIPLTEMDFALHGQTDRTLGDREFQLSVKLLSDIFNEATAKYPEQSLRFHFEARDATKASPAYMYIFAEPVTEEAIVEIQNSNREEIEAFERRIFNPPSKTTIPETSGEDLLRADDKGSEQSSSSAIAGSTARQYNPEGAALLEDIMGVDLATSLSPPNPDPASVTVPTTQGQAQVTQILAWKLNIRNIVNGRAVPRPHEMNEKDSWNVEYTLNPMTEDAGLRNYILCKNRRRTVLEAPQDSDFAVGYYIRRLVEMSREGAQWRRRMDALDAQRERVILYGDK